MIEIYSLTNVVAMAMMKINNEGYIAFSNGKNISWGRRASFFFKIKNLTNASKNLVNRTAIATANMLD